MYSYIGIRRDPALLCGCHQYKLAPAPVWIQLQIRPLIWQQGALARVEKMLPPFPPADFFGTGFPPQEARGKEGSVFTAIPAAGLEL